VVRLYRAEFSTNCERVELALGLKRLEVESVVIGYDDRSVVERVSGQGLVPVISYSGEVVSDSLRILRFLDDRHPGTPLFPADPARRAEVEVFLDWFGGIWKPAANELEAVLEQASPDPAEVERLGGEIQDWLGVFEALLDGREYLMGGEPGAADLAAFPFVKYASIEPDPADDEPFHRMLADHQRPGESHPRLVAWIERLDALPRARGATVDP
jgi:maleylacetoacetate isomerase